MSEHTELKLLQTRCERHGVSLLEEVDRAIDANDADTAALHLNLHKELWDWAETQGLVTAGYQFQSREHLCVENLQNRLRLLKEGKPLPEKQDGSVIAARLSAISRDLERVAGGRMTGDEKDMFEQWFRDGFQPPKRGQS